MHIFENDSGESLCDFTFGYWFLDSISKVFSAHEKTDLFYFITVVNSALEGWSVKKKQQNEITFPE